MSLSEPARSRAIADASGPAADYEERRPEMSRADSYNSNIDRSGDKTHYRWSYRDHYTRRLSSLGNVLPSDTDKIWCTHWLRNLPCAFGEHCKFKHEAPPDDPEVLHALGFSSMPERCFNSSKTTRKPQISLDSLRRSNAQDLTHEELDVPDDQGNMPSRSLWVGNIPDTLHEEKAFDYFIKYGPISSVRVTPNKNCMFVNYKDISSACRAWRSCHEKELFQRGTKIYVRYQANKVAPKHSTPPLHDLDPADAPMASSSLTKQGTNFAWPNGVPPTGPKSLLTELSPPRPRRPSRMDSYRPGASDEGTTKEHRRSLTWRASNPAQGGSIYRPEKPPEQHGLRRCFAGKGNLDKGMQTLTTQGEDLSTAKGISAADGKRPEDTSNSVINCRLSPTPATGCAYGTIQEQPTTHQDTSDPTGVRRTDLHSSFDRSAPDGCAVPEPHKSTAFANCPPSGFPRLLALFPATDRESNNPQTPRPVISSCDKIRASNTPLSDFTTSSVTSSQKKKCCICDKPDMKLGHLIRCATCPRRFHDVCGNPRPCDAKESPFMCSRCLKKGRSPVIRKDAGHSETADRSLDKSKVVAITPLGHQDNIPTAVEFDRDESPESPRTYMINASPQPRAESHGTMDVFKLSEDIEQTRLSPADPQTFPVFDMESVQPHDIAVDEENAKMRQIEDDQAIASQAFPSLGKNNKDHNRRPSHLVGDPQVLADAEAQARIYKTRVECPWFHGASGCYRTEKDCMFAHYRTGLASPNGHSLAKGWTCSSWQVGMCLLPAERCIYAHSDTGFYVWTDGRALKKHLTCYWYYRNGRCKKSEDQCPFAHQWTGFVAEEPNPKAHNSYTKGPHIRASLPRPSVTANPSMGTRDLNGVRDIDWMQSPAQMTASSDEYEPPSPKDTLVPLNVDARHVGTEQLSGVAAKDGTTLDPRLRIEARKTSSTENETEMAVGEAPNGFPQSDVSNTIPMLQDAQQSPDVSMLSPTTQSASVSTAPKLKDCRFCGKKLLMSQEGICTSCKTSAGSTTLLVHDDEVVPKVDDPFEDATDKVDAIISEEFGNAAAGTSTEHTATRVLKRQASASNMFISNKRSRPNPPSGSTAPVMQRVNVKGSTIDAGGQKMEDILAEMARSRSQHISEIRIDGAEQPDAGIISPQAVSVAYSRNDAYFHEPPIAGVAITEESESAEQLNKSIEPDRTNKKKKIAPEQGNYDRAPDQAIRHDLRTPAIVGFAPPVPSIKMPHLTNVQTNHDLDLVHSSTTASTSESYRSTDASRYRSVSMTSSDEEMPLAQRARRKIDQAQECLQDEDYSPPVEAVRSISVDEATQVEIQASRRPSSQETGIPFKDGTHNITMSGNLSTEDGRKSAISEANNATASVQVRCQKCSARHRKCLHNALGQLDGTKCDEWLSDRIVRNSDTGNLGNGEMRQTEEAVKAFRRQRSISGKINGTTGLREGWWHSFSKQNGATRLKPLVFTESERVRKLYFRTSSDSQVLFKVQQSSSDLLQIEPKWDRLYAREWTEVSVKYVGDKGSIHPISSHLAEIVFTYIILTDNDDSSLSFQKLWRQVEEYERLRIQRGEVVPSKSRIRRLTLEALLKSKSSISGNDNSDALSEEVSDEDASLDVLALKEVTLPDAPEISRPQLNEAQLDAPTESNEMIIRDVPHVNVLLRPGCSPLSSIHEFEPETPEDEEASTFHAAIETRTSSAYNATASSKVATTFVERREGRIEPQAMELDDSDEEANHKHLGGAGIGEEPRVLSQRSPCKRNRPISQEPNQRQADMSGRRILKDEKPEMPQSEEFQSFIASLKNSGYDFESSEDDDEEEDETITPTGQKASSSTYTNMSYDPLQAYKHTKDKHSRYYKPMQEHSSRDTRAPQLLGQKITKGQGLKNSKLVRRRAMYRNLQMFGNAHKECDRSIRHSEGYALVERRIPNTNDKWAHDVIDRRMERVSFAEFCGFSKDDEFEPCLIGDGEKAQLAFRKKEEALDHGKRRRVKNDEKWPIYPV